MTDRSHLNALELRLSNERARLKAAKKPCEIEIRAVWVSKIEDEIAFEKTFLKISEVLEPEISDDELLAALQS